MLNVLLGRKTNTQTNSYKYNSSSYMTSSDICLNWNVFKRKDHGMKFKCSIQGGGPIKQSADHLPKWKFQRRSNVRRFREFMHICLYIYIFLSGIYIYIYIYISSSQVVSCVGGPEMWRYAKPPRRQAWHLSKIQDIIRQPPSYFLWLSILTGGLNMLIRVNCRCCWLNTAWTNKGAVHRTLPLASETTNTFMYTALS